MGFHYSRTLVISGPTDGEKKTQHMLCYYTEDYSALKPIDINQPVTSHLLLFPSSDRRQISPTLASYCVRAQERIISGGTILHRVLGSKSKNGETKSVLVCVVASNC